MAEIVKSLFMKVRALINAYSEDGVLIPDADVIEMQDKSVLIADIVHKELFEIAKTDAEQEEPTTITSIDDVTEVNYKADQAMVYYIAARLAPFKKNDLVQFFEDEWTRLKAKCSNKVSETEIEDVYNINNGGG